MKYYLIAGEASGDLHGSNLMKALMKDDPDATFRFLGGDKMKSVGGTLFRHYNAIAFMGFSEVIFNIRTILRALQDCKKDITEWDPDVLILVDFPGFNMRIMKFAKKLRGKVVYYISPQIWAWKEKRVHELAQYTDEILVILPFEKDFYQKFGYSVCFVGHPLLDAIDSLEGNPGFRAAHNLDDRPIVALLPGSRKQEIMRKLPVMAAMAERFPAFQFVVAGLSHHRDDYLGYTGNHAIAIVVDQTYELLRNAHAALVTSGTATLETALFNVPEVVCYKGSTLSYAIGRRLVKVNFIGLVNLIMGEEIVKELVQSKFNKHSLEAELNRILQEPIRMQMMESFQLLRSKLGGPGASTRAARRIISIAKESKQT